MDKPISYQAYQDLADSYAALVPTKDYNAYYDRPATLSLIDDVLGQHVLDAGCGPGIYTEILLNLGATVTGLDASENMLKHAQYRVGDRARLLHGNLDSPLSQFQDQEFDGILSALTITYIQDLQVLFKEFHRILKPQGWFVFSTEHPFFAFFYFGLENYFNTQAVVSTWKSFDKPIYMPCYYHSLSTLTDALIDNGFAIERILEPLPDYQFKAVNPASYAKRMNTPSFIHFKAIKK